METATKRKQRVIAQMVAHRKELRLFGVVSTTGNRVVLQFAGIKEEFWFHANQESYRTINEASLDPKDEQVLWRLAQAARDASRAGYTPDAGRKKRRTVEPKPLTNVRKTRKDKQIEAARQTMLYQLYANKAESTPYFLLQSITGQEVYLRVGDYVQHVLFHPKFGHGKLQPSGYRLTLEWWSFICCFGDTLLLAAQKGYRSVNPPAKDKSANNPTPKYDPRQSRWQM